MRTNRDMENMIRKRLARMGYKLHKISKSSSDGNDYYQIYLASEEKPDENAPAFTLNKVISFAEEAREKIEDKKADKRLLK